MAVFVVVVPMETVSVSVSIDTVETVLVGSVPSWAVPVVTMKSVTVLSSIVPVPV